MFDETFINGWIFALVGIMSGLVAVVLILILVGGR